MKLLGVVPSTALVVLVTAALAGCGTSTPGGTSASNPGSAPHTAVSKTTVFATLPPESTSTTTSIPVVGPAAASADSSAAAAGTATAGATPADPNATTNYTVQANDLLVRIAKRFRCKYTDIMSANNYAGDPNKFLPAAGRTIVLPASCMAATSTTNGTKPTTAKSPTSTASSSTTKPGTKTTATTAPASTYTVVANDTLTAIAKRKGTSVSAIVAANAWTDGASHRINPGDVIKLPGKTG